MTVVQIAGMAAVALTSLVARARAMDRLGRALAVEGLIGSAALVDSCPWLTRRLAPPPLWVMARVLRVSDRRRVGALRRATATGVLQVATARWSSAGSVSSSRRHSRIGSAAAARDVSRRGPGRRRDRAVSGWTNAQHRRRRAGIDDVRHRRRGSSSPAFWALGVRRLDYMSVTHGDVDHIGGAASVFRDFRPFEVWEGVPVPPHAPTRELRALADRAGAAWRTLQPADRVSFGAVELVVHHPPRPEWERQRVRNDDSEVLEIRYGGVSFVFTGDIGREVERAIARSFDARADPDPESAAPRQRDIELAGVSRRAAPGHRRHQRRTREPIRPPGAERAGALPEHRARRFTGPIRTGRYRWRRTARP